MRLRKLNLTRYGRFTDFSIDLGDRPTNSSDLHIIFGENEAGKSTAFDGYLDLLFEIEDRSKYNFLHDYSALRVGAILEIDGQDIELSRIKRRDGNLLGEADRAVDPAILSAALHGLSRDAYRTMFCLNDETLVQGGEEVLASRGDLGRLLFAATAGLGDLSDGLDALREKAAKFYVPRSRSSELKSLIDELGALDERRRTLDTNASAFDSLVENHRQAEEAYQAARDNLDNVRAEHKRLSALKDAFSIRDGLLILEEQLQPIAHLRAAPTGWSAEVVALKEVFAAALAKKGDSEADIKAADGRLEGLVSDPEIDSVRAEIALLEMPAARDRTAYEDLPKRLEELAMVDAKLEEIRARLGAKEDSDLTSLIIPDDRLARLDELTAREAALAQRVTSAREEVSVAEDALQSAVDDLEAAPAQSADMASLTSLLDQLNQDNPEQRDQQAVDTLERLNKSIERELNRLAPWSAEEADLASASLPDAQQSDRWSKTVLELAQKLKELEDRREQLQEAHARNVGIVSALSLQSDGIADAEAKRVRNLRDQAWDSHRSHLNDETADAFEVALGEDDRVRDDRPAAADRLAELRAAEIEVAATDASLEIIAEQIEDARCDLSALRKEMAPILSDVGLPAEYPAEDLPGWIERAEALQDLIAEADAQRSARDRAAAACEASKAALVEALKALGEQSLDTLTLRQLHARANSLRDRAIEDKATRTAATKNVEAAKVQKRQRDRALSSEEQAFANWQGKWADALEGLWLATRSTTQVRALLDPLRGLAKQSSKRIELSGRIEAMERDRTAFRDTVGQLSASLEVDSDQDPTAMYAQLKTRLKAADDANTASQAADEARLVAEERHAKAEAELLRVQTRLKQMARHFPEKEAITNLDELAEILERSQQRADLADAVEAKERDLIERLGVDSRKDADVLLDAENRAGVDRVLSGIDNDLSETEGELEDRIGGRRDAVRAIEEVGGDAAAALLEEERRSVLIEIAEKADRALSVQLGVIAAERALAVYRDRHRSELLANTADAFRTITRGGFHDLTTQPDRNGDRLIALRSNGGGSIGADEMSKGTRFQLYLALRLAGYRRFCDVAGPLPFIGDDVMETFDDRRAEATLGLLSEIAQDGQALYFTHHEHLCEIAKKVCGDKVTIHEIPKLQLASGAA